MLHTVLGYVALAGAVAVFALPLMRVVDQFIDRAIGRHVALALASHEFDVWVDEALDLTRDDVPASHGGGAHPCGGGSAPHRDRTGD